MRFFGGLSAREIAEVLGISEPSVLRDWKIARSWLMNEMDSQESRRIPGQKHRSFRAAERVDRSF
jgi:DNA-directed RNA polymerase specialized sigma24 family protein